MFERASRPGPKRVCLLLSVLFAAAVVYPGEARAEKEPVVVGSKKFTESVILGDIVKGLVTSTGRAARHRA